MKFSQKILVACGEEKQNLNFFLMDKVAVIILMVLKSNNGSNLKKWGEKVGRPTLTKPLVENTGNA
jgi:hypothetical protein